MKRIKHHYSIITLFVTLLLANTSMLQAQQLWEDVAVSNLFRYVKPLVEAGVNFENFNKNFAACVRNADEIRVLAITYAGEIKTKRQARKLLRHNIQHGAPGWGLSSAYKPGDTDSYFKLNIDQKIDSTKIDISSMVDTIDQLLHIGDAVYKMKLSIISGEVFDYYVFIKDDTNEVVTKGNMFAFDMPVEYIQRKLQRQK